MKTTSLATIALTALVSTAFARPDKKFRTYDGDDPLEEKSRVTAFVNTDEGIKIECWEIGSITRHSQSGRGIYRTSFSAEAANKPEVDYWSFAAESGIFDVSANGMRTTGVDFTRKANLFNVKGGIIAITARGKAGSDAHVADDDEVETHIFSLENGDDWFYFEDTGDSEYSMQASKGDCAKTRAESQLIGVAKSATETTLINLAYEQTPKHTVLHEGACNFAGLKPADTSSRSQADYVMSPRFKTQKI